MAKLAFSLMLFCVFLAMPMVKSRVLGPEENDEWFQKLHNAKEKLTRLHFYFHDVQSGKNATSVKVVDVANTSKSAIISFFGQVNMFDNLLTEGPKPRSKLVGRAQGLYGFASQEEMGLIMAVNFVFTSGKYNGSSLTILGHNPVLHRLREMPIVGGTGVFRLARGFATAKTYSANPNGNAIVEYNVAAFHY